MLLLKRGVTLTEILVVLVIISILSAIAYPQYQKYIRRGRQLEAKTNLGVVYQKQLAYLSSELRFSKSLKTIGAVPTGRIRYNIGTDWAGGSDPEDRLNQGTSADLCPCHNDQRGQNIPTHSCWADPNPEGTETCGGTRVCYGAFSGQSMSAQLIASGISSPALGNNILLVGIGFEITGGKFEYYAIGCTSPRFRQIHQLDIWSINHIKNLKNIKVGL